MPRRGLALVAGAVALALGTSTPLSASHQASAAAVPLVVVAPRATLGKTWDLAGSAGRAGKTIRLEVMLRPSHPAIIGRLLAGLYNPSSASYHRFLPKGAFERRFKPSPVAVERLRAYLVRFGLRVRDEGFALSLQGPLHAVEAAFGAKAAPRTASSRTMPKGGPLLLPRDLARTVAGVLGPGLARPALAHLVRVPLTPLERPKGLGDLARSGVPEKAQARVGGARSRLGLRACPSALAIAQANQAVTLDQVGAHYGVDSLLAAGADGRGQTIAVYELAAYSPSSIATYFACEGLSSPIRAVVVDSGAQGQLGAGTTEADLDIEQVATQAPGASILAYEGPDTPVGQYDVWARIVEDDLASVISTSWGLCELADAGAIAGEATLFEQAAAQGQTIVAASGDSGSEDCWPSGPNGAAVDFPASDPYVTGVGGTTLHGAGDVVWNDCEGAATSACASAGGSASGGGLSSVFAEPSWQRLVLAPSGGSCGAPACRGVPDLAVNAGTTEVIYDGGGWVGAQGTSAAAPLVAGLVADLADTCATRLGSLNPALYAQAAAGGYGTVVADVTSGDNDLTGATAGAYSAGVGYDLASGLGTPIGSGLACPSVMAVQPESAPAGAQVRLVGSGLDHARIDFGTVPAHLLQSGPTFALVVVPPGSGQVAVRALSPLGVGQAVADFLETPSPSAPEPSLQVGEAVPGTPLSGVRAPGELRLALRGDVVELSWQPSPGPVAGYALDVRACALGRSCRVVRLVLGASRRSAALREAPGRYAISLFAIGPLGDSAVVRRSVQIRAGQGTLGSKSATL